MLGELCQPTGTGPELFHKFMMNASVEMSKGNRRKQSKPNRLFADDENAMFPRGTTGSPQVDSSPRTSPVQVRTLPLSNNYFQTFYLVQL